MLALVTGGCGFIGGHIVDKLLEEGNEVISIDDMSATSTEEFYKNDNCKNYKIDIRDKAAVMKLSRELLEQGKKIDYVFHLAARTKIQIAIKDCPGTFETNVNGTVNILEMCREHEVRRLVFSSTSAIYGNNSYPNVETQKSDCLNPYASSKLCGEEICDLYSNVYGIETVKLRYFNVYGERMPNKGSYAPVVAIFEKQKREGLPLTIVGDGTQKRDFIYVGDVASANLMVSKAPAESVLREVFNVGAGKNFVIKDIANFMSSEQVHIPNRENEAGVTLAQVDKLRSATGWTPTVDLMEWIATKGFGK